MKVCGRCGVEYQPITGVEHNGIHTSRPITMIYLGEGVTREEVERFREYWASTHT
jgi:hypothetical protein